MSFLALGWFAALSALGESPSANLDLLSPGLRNRDLPCPQAKLARISLGQPTVDWVPGVSLAPRCVWRSLRRKAARQDARIRGFAFGFSGEVSESLGVQAGLELVIIQTAPGEVEVGLVGSKGGDASIGLPGVSAGQAVLLGDCPNGVTSYLGWFTSYSVLAFGRSFGVKSPLDPVPREIGNRCDSISLTLGMTSALLGSSRVHTVAVGASTRFTGDRVRELTDYLDRVNASERGTRSALR